MATLVLPSRSIIPRNPVFDFVTPTHLPNRNLRPQQHTWPLFELSAGAAVYLYFQRCRIRCGVGVLCLCRILCRAVGVWAGNRLFPFSTTAGICRRSGVCE